MSKFKIKDPTPFTGMGRKDCKMGIAVMFKAKYGC
jgi:hypothetical protein